MRNRTRPLMTLLLAGVFAWMGTALAPVVAGAASGAKVTAVVGSAQLGGNQALEHLSGVTEGEPLETAKDGGCSVLLEEDAVVELCGDTQLSLRKRAPGEPRVLDVQKGNVRVSAEKRLGDERIEIHTPAVIATILGTVVFISVDALGITTVTAEMSKEAGGAPSRVMIASSNTALSQATVIEDGQQLVIKPGEPPPVKPLRLDAPALSALGGCLVDFHEASLQADRKQMHQREAEVISDADATTADLPVVALLEPPSVPGVDDPGPPVDPVADPSGDPEVYESPQVIPEIVISDPPGPPGDDFPSDCQGGFPSDGCGPF